MALMFSKLQLYAAAIAAFAISLLGVYFAGMSRGKDKLKGKLDEHALDNLRTAKDVQDEIHQMDNDELSSSARDWLRKDNS